MKKLLGSFLFSLLVQKWVFSLHTVPQESKQWLQSLKSFKFQQKTIPRIDHQKAHRTFSSSKGTIPPSQSQWLLKLTYRLESISGKYQFVFTDDTVPLNSVGNLLQHFQPKRRDRIKQSLSLWSHRVYHPWKKRLPAKRQNNPTIRIQYLCPSRDSLPKVMQELISVGPQLTERKFSFESRLVRVLVVLLNTESLLR